jgi:hypothetical protein
LNRFAAPVLNRSAEKGGLDRVRRPKVPPVLLREPVEGDPPLESADRAPSLPPRTPLFRHHGWTFDFSRTASAAVSPYGICRR